MENVGYGKGLDYILSFSKRDLTICSNQVRKNLSFMFLILSYLKTDGAFSMDFSKIEIKNSKEN
jgi:hypothetical protein